MIEPVETKLERSNAPTQFAWYLVVGGLSFLADITVFAALLQLGAPVMAALIAGFVLATFANYALSLLLAFTHRRHQRVSEILRLFAVALAGLGLTALFVWTFMALCGLSALTAKLIATLIVLPWNYLGRRLFVFHPNMPIWTWRLSMRAYAAAHTAAAPPAPPSMIENAVSQNSDARPSV